MTIDPFPPSRRSKPSACIFLGLDILRAISIIAMLLLFAGQIHGCVKDAKAVKQAVPVDEDYECDYVEFSSVPDRAGGLFWVLLCRIFILLAIIIILPAEIHIPTKKLQGMYASNLPVLSPLHGLGFLGVLQCWIAAVILGRYIAKFEQATGWIGFIVGCLNGIAGIVWRASAKEKRKIFSWENVAQLTPQTKVAHTVYRTCSDKYDRFDPIVNAVGGFILEKHAIHKAKGQTSSTPPSHVSSTEDLLHDGRDGSHTGYTEPDLNAHPRTNGTTVPGLSFGGFGFGKQREKTKLAELHISQPAESLPRYASAETLRRPRSDV